MKQLTGSALFAICFALSASAFAQTDVSPTPTLSPLAQPTPSSQMQGMDKMSEMCQMMMKHENQL